MHFPGLVVLELFGPMKGFGNFAARFIVAVETKLAVSGCKEHCKPLNGWDFRSEGVKERRRATPI